MALNKQDKDNLTTALFYLKGGFKDKPEISENKQTESWRGKPPIPIMGGASVLNNYAKDLDKEGDLDDEDLLRSFAGLVFDKVKNYPELMRELKEKYFKTL